MYSKSSGFYWNSSTDIQKAPTAALLRPRGALEINIFRKLHMIVAGTCNYVHLLLFCQVDEFNCIAGYTDCEVCILRFLRVLHCVDQFFRFRIRLRSGDVHPARSIRPERVPGSRYALSSLWPSAPGLMVWVLEIPSRASSYGSFCYRVQGSKKSALLCAVRRVSSWRQRLTGFSSVRQRTSCFTIYNVWK